MAEAERCVCIRPILGVILPDGEHVGALWGLGNGIVYVEVDGIAYAVDFSIQDDVEHICRVRVDKNGNPILQGLPV